MGQKAEMRKKNIAFSISQNPASITIKRTGKVREGSGFNEVDETLGPFTVRIFQQYGAAAKVISELVGTKTTDSNWGLLADHTIDIKDDSDTRDEFDAPGIGHLVIKRVYPMIIESELVGYQAELERVN